MLRGSALINQFLGRYSREKKCSPMSEKVTWGTSSSEMRQERASREGIGRNQEWPKSM